MPHEWTPVAPEEIHRIQEKVRVWKWCIRCGALKLGNELFYAGEKQTLVIQNNRQIKRPKNLKPCV